MDACPCMAWRYCSFQVPTTTSLVVRCEQGTSDVVLASLIDVKRLATTPLLGVLAQAWLLLRCSRSEGVGWRHRSPLGTSRLMIGQKEVQSPRDAHSLRRTGTLARLQGKKRETG